jgi:hypothetical protein
MGSGYIDPRFLDLSSSWKGMISFMPGRLYPQHPLGSRLGGPQSWSERYEEVKILDPTRIQTLTSRSSRKLSVMSIHLSLSRNIFVTEAPDVEF